jgi:2-amino-4-hydroxy-6-hydroxymethyldihydropteridine diphosphokinase
VRTLIALGSNLGDRRENIARALALLEEAGIEVLAESEILETAAVGGNPALPYLNAVVEVNAPPDPFGLLDRLKAIECRMGRDLGAPRNSPRIIDLDIIACQGTTVSSPRLTIPHPRLWRRAFVLEPLASLAARRRPVGEEFFLRH